MSEEQGDKKGQDSSDATVKDDPAIPAEPTALSDKDLGEVAGGGVAGGPGTHSPQWAPRAPQGGTFKKP